jgi:putative transferase (TIGR04331 family)
MKKKLIKTIIDLESKDLDKRKLIFLGNHCNFFDYNKNKLIDNCNNEDKNWKKYDNFIKDYDYLTKLHDKILVSLVSSLNKFHNIDKKKNFWEIIIGPWLMTFCVNIFHKWKISQNFIYDESICTEIDNDTKLVQPYSSIENYKREINTEHYNQYLFSKIFLFLDQKKISKIEIIQKKNKNITYLSHKNTNKKKSQRFREHLSKLMIKIFSQLTKKNEVVILRNYLGFINNLKLNFSLKQLPNTYQHNLNFENLIKNKKRVNLKIFFREDNLLESFLSSEILNHIPEAFLEKFDDIFNKIKNSNLPLCPRKIFVTNFSYNTFLSFYIAISKENGSRIILGQHGGCYGQYDRHWIEEFEIGVSDSFLTYGWMSRNNSEKTVPIGMLKPIDKNNQFSIKKKKNILFIIRSRSKYISKLDSGTRSNYEFDYLDNTFFLIDNLNKRIKKNSKIRLRDIDLGWAEHPRFKEKFPDIRIDYGTSNIFKLMKNSKIVVSTSLSTSYLETLSMNIPTVIVTNFELEPVRSECKEYLDLLIESKILHLNPNTATTHLNSIYDKVENWWFDQKLQNNIKIFCEKYAKLNYKINNDLKKILD